MEEKGAKVSRLSRPVVRTEEPKVSDVLVEVTQCWNSVVDALISARDNWDKMQKALATVPRDTLQLAPIQVQKATMRFRKAGFNVMLSRFSDYYRAYGGLEAMKVKGAERDGR